MSQQHLSMLETLIMNMTRLGVEVQNGKCSESQNMKEILQGYPLPNKFVLLIIFSSSCHAKKTYYVFIINIFSSYKQHSHRRNQCYFNLVISPTLIMAWIINILSYFASNIHTGESRVLHPTISPTSQGGWSHHNLVAVLLTQLKLTATI